MSTIWDLTARLGIENSGFIKGMDDAARKSESSGSSIVSSLTKVGGAVVMGAFAAAAGGAVALAGFLGTSVRAASEAEGIQAQLGAVLKSTGGIAGVTAKQVNDLATQLGNTTKFEDDTVVAGENMLLTFTNIGKNVFPLATQTMLDMSQAMGTDLQSSAIQLGKALNDPTQGMTALTRVGVTFSDSQKVLIENLQKAGDLEGAQAVILKELQTEFGGAAVAAGDTFAGKLTILKNAFGNIQETIGGALLPVLTTLATTLSDKLADPKVQAWIADFAVNVGNFASKVIEYIPQVISWLQGVGVTVATVYQAWLTNWNSIKDTVKTITDAIGLVLSGFIALFSGDWQGFADGINSAWDKVWPLIQSAAELGWQALKDWVAKAIPDFINAFNSIDWAKIGTDILNGIWNGLKAGWQWLADQVAALAAGLMATALGAASGMSGRGGFGTNNGTAPIYLPPANYSGAAAPVTHRGEQFDAGGSFTIPSIYGHEGFNMGGVASASGGEGVTITPKGGKPGGDTYNIYTQDNPNKIIAAIERKQEVKRAMA